jgi:hypothetical protein
MDILQQILNEFEVLFPETKQVPETKQDDQEGE